MEKDIFDADRISRQIRCGVNALDAVYTAMENGPSKPEEYIDALFGVWNYLDGLCGQLQEAICGEIAGRRKANE